MNLSEVKEKAELGLSPAQTILGCAYLYGEFGLERDYQQAKMWLSLAAEKGVSRAVLNLAYMYEEGLGVPVDIPTAISLFERVARSEFAAAVELGRIYSSGLHVPEDKEKACHWYSAAVNNAQGVDPTDPDVLTANAYLAKHCNTIRDFRDS